MANENGSGGPITSHAFVLRVCMWWYWMVSPQSFGGVRLSYMGCFHLYARSTTHQGSTANYLPSPFHSKRNSTTTTRTLSPEQDGPNGHDARITKPIHSFPKKPRIFIGLVLLVRPVPHHPQPFTVVEIAQYLFLFLSLKQASLCHLLGRRKAEIEENGLYVPVLRYLDTR